jgi:type VI secretion system secreted protein Hcp
MVLGVLVLLLSIPVHVQAAYEFYVTIEGTKQGKFKGESSRKGSENKSSGVRFQYEVKLPRDINTGQATGKRQHGPVIITKLWGSASPQLFQALVTNEALKSVLIEFVRTNPQGQEYIFQIIKLTNASIASIRQYANVANPGETVTPGGLEDVAFTFQRIEITNQDGKTMAMDDWGH